MKRLSKLVVALVAVFLVMGHTPADAASAAGAVTGNVNVTPGIIQDDPLTTPVECAATSYTFGSTVIAGAVIGAPNYAGTVNVTAFGNSACENANGATGTVNVTCNGGLGVSAPPPAVTTTFACSLSGTFTRSGPLVIVTLGGTTSAGPVAGLTVVALFIPTNTGLVTGGPVSALFAGVFVAV